MTYFTNEFGWLSCCRGFVSKGHFFKKKKLRGDYLDKMCLVCLFVLFFINLFLNFHTFFPH